jgi:hypothetical protein
MARDKVERVSNDVNGADSSNVGERSAELVELKDKLGLPKWNDLQQELAELAKRHDITWANELQAKVELHRKYAEYQTLLMLNFKSMGLDNVNAMRNMIDLQVKLFELEEKLRADGVNPLESDEWVRGREMLAKEMQFIHKHKLDVATFQANVGKIKNKIGDDDMFVVEAKTE